MSIDFRMTSTTLLSDVVLPAATWYEKDDLSSTDMHPFVHAFSPAIDPPWETRSDFEAFGAIARAFSALAADASGCPHATWCSARCSTTRPGRWRIPVASNMTGAPPGRRRCPGKTMGPIAVVERDYAGGRRQVGDARPAGRHAWD